MCFLADINILNVNDGDTFECQDSSCTLNIIETKT